MFKHGKIIPQTMNALCILQTTLKYRLWNVTSIVCVFPEDVCPYANIVPLYPSSTSEKIRDFYTSGDLFPLKKTHKKLLKNIRKYSEKIHTDIN